MASRPVSPFPPNAPLGSIDQGVDYAVPFVGPIYAIGSGKVYKVDEPGTHPWGGGGAVYYKLDVPVTISGRTYSEVYVAEAGRYNVQVGDPVRAGEQIAYTISGWQESGFALNGGPAGPDNRVGGRTQPTQEGRDFLALAQGRSTQTSPGPGITRPGPGKQPPPNYGDPGKPPITGDPSVPPLDPGWSPTPGSIPIIGGLWDSINSVLDFLKAALWLVNPTNWLRMVEFLAGFGILVLALKTLVDVFKQPNDRQSSKRRTMRYFARRAAATAVEA